VSEVLDRWNALTNDEASRSILPCCGSRAWASALAARRPLLDASALLSASDEIWRSLPEEDWLEAFRSHPRIGESKAQESVAAQSSAWSEQEQQKAAAADEAMKLALKWGNREYEQRFGRIFIVCATGKPASEILEILRRRLHNDEKTELQQAAEEQRQIMNLRLRKWIAG
jgi:2-oxo-4-hydroxy-4-carboxy-5-ureidoimidazoline decarboxylase